MYLKSSKNMASAGKSPAKETPQPNSVHMRATFCGKARHSWDKVARKIPGPSDNFWTENSKLLMSKSRRMSESRCPNRGRNFSNREKFLSRGGGINSPGRPGPLRAACFLKKFSLDKGHGVPFLTKVFLSTVLGAPDC